MRHADRKVGCIQQPVSLTESGAKANLASMMQGNSPNECRRSWAATLDRQL